MMFEMKTELEDQKDVSLLDLKNILIKDENESDEDEPTYGVGRIELFKKLQNRLTSKNMSAFPHHVALSLNSHEDFVNLENIEEVYKPLPYCSSYPKPYSSFADNKTTDPCLQLVSDKKSWNIKVMKFRKHYKSLLKRRKFEKITTKKSKIVIPLYLYNFTKLLHNDPDPYFDSHYNWYYGGNGNLCAVEYDNKKYILYSTNDTLYVQQFSDTFNNQYDCKYTPLNKQSIFETVSIMFNDKLVIGLRQKFRMYLIELVKKSDSLSLELFKTIKSDVPFVSFFIDSSDNNVYYTCADGSIYVYNVMSNESSILYDSGIKTISPNNLLSVQHLNDDILLCTNKNFIKTLDKRCNEINKLPISMLNCERISASRPSVCNQNSIYVSSTHNVLLYDLRYTEKKGGFQKQWSHGLKYAPIFMSNRMFNEDELVNVSSQTSVESCMIVNTLKSFKNEPATSSVQQTIYPWHPHSIYDSFKKIILKGICLDPTLNVRNRVNMSRCGSLFLKDENKLSLYTLNSIGDIFVQHITEINDPSNIEELYDKYSQWNDFLYTKISNDQFIASSMINMTEYQEKMRRNVKINVPMKASTNLLTSKQHWKNSINFFSQCTDLCAQELLDMWGFKDNMDDGVQISAEAKVETWMDTIQ